MSTPEDEVEQGENHSRPMKVVLYSTAERLGASAAYSLPVSLIIFSTF
jgi:hypothetical protein